MLIVVLENCQYFSAFAMQNIRLLDAIVYISDNEASIVSYNQSVLSYHFSISIYCIAN